MSEPIRVLLLENNAGDVLLIEELLRDCAEMEFELHHARSVSEGLDCVERDRLDVVLMDMALPDGRGLDAITRLYDAAPAVPILVLTSVDDEAMAIKAVKASAQDYLVKGLIDTRSLTRAIVHAIERHRLQRDLAAYAQRLSASEVNFSQVITKSADGIIIARDGGEILFVNPAAENLLHKQVDLQVGRLFPHPLIVGNASELPLRDGRFADMRVTETSWAGRRALLATLRDITGSKRSEGELKLLTSQLEVANHRLEKMANIDPLTGLLNRRGLEANLLATSDHAIASGLPLVALLLDCDDFKRVNDTLGHAVGDVVLTEMTRRIRTSLRTSDLLARIGGDEFLMILSDTRASEAKLIADRVRLAVATQPLEVSGRVVRITASLGLCELPFEVVSVEEILALAHAALKQSKRAGKNRVSSGAAPQPGGEISQLERVAEALRRGECFHALAQKLVHLKDNSIYGYELLTRCTISDFENPDDFFRVCLEANILNTVDIQCLKVCVAAATELSAQGQTTSPSGARKPVFHVNLFPSTILDTPPERLVSFFPRASTRTPQFCVEISEQQFIGDPSVLRESVAKLKEARIRVAIDDVGFGRSSLESLIVLEPDVVKIDRKAIQHIAEDASKRRLLTRLVKVVHSLGAEIIAEGIETERDLAVVKDLGIGMGQGFFWSVGEFVSLSAPNARQQPSPQA